ncbi:MAG: TolC family protein [Bacillati bacterium ANGP1]|uniref:TolC family protein n=1 Tax=Candidatus Segetimicrobium genomatis TaxID=2569760 RepID=A0A537M4W3_9BACT|nr:MAG: TolC family protein [Terrabacteria group bacterium ANGP1]
MRPRSGLAVRLGLLITCLLLPWGTAWGQGAPSPAASPAALALDHALQQALGQNPQVLAARASVIAAQQNLAVARTGLAPTISANGTGTYGTSSSTSSTLGGLTAPLTTITGTGSVSLGASLPLYDGGRTEANVQAAEAALASAQAALRQTEQDTALGVATAFFNVLQAERLATVREALLLQAQAQLELSQARVRAGVAAQSDVIQARAQVAQAQVDLLAARSQVGTSKASLQGSIGVDAAEPVEVQEPPVPPGTVTASAEAAMQTAETTRPEVAKAQAAVSSEQAALDLARVAAGPQVTVGVGTTYTPLSTSPVLNNATSYGVSATVSLPLYDSGKGRAEIGAAQAALQGAQAQLRGERLAVRQDAYQAYLSAVQAAANIQATQAAKAAADEALRVAEGRYRAGVGTIVELITARAQAAQADVNAVNGLYAYETALATLRHAEGLPIQASALGGGQ